MLFFIFNFDELTFGFRIPSTYNMFDIVDLHHEIFFYLIVIFCMVSWLLVFCIFDSKLREKKSKKNNQLFYAKNFYHCSALEFIWTIIPSFILFLIAIPSLSSLYGLDSVVVPKITIKAIGCQWFWTYEFPDLADVIKGDWLILDSNLVKEDFEAVDYSNLFSNQKFWFQEKNLTTDLCLELMKDIPIRLLVTSLDVIHSFAISDFGVKIDCIPGRLNEIKFQIVKEGLYYGQCSELCGLGHGFMPIVIHVSSVPFYSDLDNVVNYKRWLYFLN